QAVSKAADEVVKASQPPREVPEMLPARQLVELAERYLQLGWTEQARDALENAISLEPKSLVAGRARSILLTRLPKQPVPYIACEGLIEARRALMQGDIDKSREKLTELIQRYPSFENPYNELGMINLKDGDLDLARDNVTMAIELNPNYLDAWLNLARINASACQLLDAQRCLDRASALDEDDDRIAAIRPMLSILARL
ncbi:MAG: tetratricopeptide repeat protein, partial [Cyanobacteria bacterium]|nr:tetratricopeptide repeat protein [Cyanobacteriota bacterium]